MPVGTQLSSYAIPGSGGNQIYCIGGSLNGSYVVDQGQYLTHVVPPMYSYRDYRTLGYPNSNGHVVILDRPSIVEGYRKETLQFSEYNLAWDGMETTRGHFYVEGKLSLEDATTLLVNNWRQTQKDLYNENHMGIVGSHPNYVVIDDDTV